MNKPSRYEEEIAREIVVKVEKLFDNAGTPEQMPLNLNWMIAQALASYRKELSEVAAKYRNDKNNFYDWDKKVHFINKMEIAQAILNYGEGDGTPS